MLRIDPVGICKVTHIFRDKNGKAIPVSFSDAIADKNIKVPLQKITRSNLVVNSGREKLAFLLGKRKTGLDYPVETGYIDRLVLGDCKVDGDVSKIVTHLGTTSLQSEIRNLGGTNVGRFVLDPDTDITFPESADRYGDPWVEDLADITLSGGDWILTDAAAEFISGVGVQRTDQVTINDDPIIRLGIKEIISETEIVLHNPTGYNALGVEYKISSPGTQVLFSKFIDGNDFTQADFGVAIVVHEAGLLFNDDTLFNRVVFRPDDNELGVIIQSDEENGISISPRFEFLVTF